MRRPVPDAGRAGRRLPSRRGVRLPGMMRIVAADEPADLVTCAQGIAGSADGRRVPVLIELGRTAENRIKRYLKYA